MKLQVVMPSLNQGRFIGYAIESLLGQDVDRSLQVVIVDACSSDQTHAEIGRMLERWPEHDVRLVIEPDRGQSDAINKGMALGDGDVVAWLNADDRLLPGSLHRWKMYWQTALTDGAVAVYGDAVVTNEDGRVIEALIEQDFDRRDLLWGPCYIPQPSTTVARWAWDEVGGVSRHLDYAMDLDLWLRLSEIGRIDHIPRVLSEFRRHPASKSEGFARAVYIEAREVRRKHATLELGRRPTTLEMETRHVAVRVKRRLRASVRSRRRGAAQLVRPNAEV